jgi:RND superfamily putative drug exporter
MPFDTMRWMVSRHPGRVVAAWVLVTLAVVLAAPDLTRLSAEGQARMLPRDAESVRAAELIAGAWPEEAYHSMVVVGLHRPAGLTEADRAFARDLSRGFVHPQPPANVIRVLGPESRPEVAGRLSSADGTLQLVAAQLATSFVSPSTQEVVRRLQERAGALPPPPGLEILWSGDAVVGRDYMHNVKVSLDRAAAATVFLLLGVLLAVYRSLWLALVPLATIGVGLLISRGVLAWMYLAGWEISPLVELFLVVILFGCGTDFCLFLSWRFGEHWNPTNPSGAMRATLRRSVGPLLTSAFTVIAGLSLMGTTRFKLFSATGPSVALGLALTLVATLTLTPALLVLLARHRPRAFAGLTAPPSGIWNEVGRRVLARPVLAWLLTILVMLPPAVLGLRTAFIMDMLSEMSGRTAAVRGLNLIAEKFGPGSVAPLTVVLTAEGDLRQSEGLALIDDVSRLLSHQKRLAEVRSATQPLGSPEPLGPARLASRLAEVNDGFAKMADGAQQLQNGLTQGAAKLRTAILLEGLTGVSLTGTPAPSRAGPGAPEPAGEAAPALKPGADTAASGLRQATSALLGLSRLPVGTANIPSSADPTTPIQGQGPREQMLRELTRAADGAQQIADGARRARRELSSILADPSAAGPGPAPDHAGDRAREPGAPGELRRLHLADGRLARIDVVQADRMFSARAMEEVDELRRRLRDYLGEMQDRDGLRPAVAIGGGNAESADTQNLTRRDQYQTWVLIPLGVFLILVVSLRDVWACLNLVATMVLTYAFALGVTHLVFVTAWGPRGWTGRSPSSCSCSWWPSASTTTSS